MKTNVLSASMRPMTTYDLIVHIGKVHESTVNTVKVPTKVNEDKCAECKYETNETNDLIVYLLLTSSSPWETNVRLI